MQRTQISLTDEDRDLLGIEAARTGRSIAALIRDAIRSTYGTADSLDEDLEVLDRVHGCWAERTYDGEKWVDERRSGSRLRAAER